MKPRLVGINHVALEVADIERSLEFYSDLFEIELRGRAPGAAFVDIGDQFLALMEGPSEGADRARHFGLVVDDKAAVRRALQDADVEVLAGRGLDFLDPDGNLVQVVDYREIQFTKAGFVLNGMGLGDLKKTQPALNELRERGFVPDDA